MADTSSDGDVLGFFADLVRCETRLYNLLDERLRREHGIVTSQFEFLRHVHTHPGSRVADLAVEFAVGVGATSKAVDRLQARGLLSRRPNPGDRRSMVLEVTEEGDRLVQEAERVVRTQLHDLMAPADLTRDNAAAVLRMLRATLEDQRLGMPTG